MRSIFSRFHGFGFFNLLSAVSGLGGPGTIESELKVVVRLYKLCTELKLKPSKRQAWPLRVVIQIL